MLTQFAYDIIQTHVSLYAMSMDNLKKCTEENIIQVYPYL